MTKLVIIIATVALLCSSVLAFTSSPCSAWRGSLVCKARSTDEDEGVGRRNFMGSVSLAGLAFFSPRQSAWAIPSATTEEFDILLKGSAKSVQVVEFAGPKSDIVTVRLVDGTVFGINDVVESPYDPRSPLKLAATCRENKVATKFTNLEQALATTPRRKQVYMNARVQEAAKKEKAKAERMAQDEADNELQLLKMQEADAEVKALEAKEVEVKALEAKEVEANAAEAALNEKKIE